MSQRLPPHQSSRDEPKQGTPGRSGESGIADDSENSNKARVLYYAEDRLPRTWRSLASSVVFATAKADKVPSSQEGNATAKQAALKEVDDAVVGLLRSRLELNRLISYLEAKLEGQATEMESLQHYVRSQPSLKRRSRKRKLPDDASKAGNTNAT